MTITTIDPTNKAGFSPCTPEAHQSAVQQTQGDAMRNIDIPRIQRTQIAIAFRAGAKAIPGEESPFSIGEQIDPCSVSWALTGAYQAGRYRQAGDRLLALVMLHSAKRSMVTAVKLGRAVAFV